MRSTKILILALGLMALTATAFAQGPDLQVTPFTASGGAPRIIATNSDTGEVATVILTSLRGDEEDPGVLPGSPDPQQVKESIYYTFSHPISALSDIFVIMQLPGEPDAQLTAAPTAYNTWVGINRGGSDIARMRVGINATDMNIVQIQFLEDTSFYEGSTIELSGVRVNLSGASPGGEEVFVDFTTAEGSAVITNNHILVARSTDPLTCIDCQPTIQFRADGTAIHDIATLTVRELFHNAFEAPVRVQLYITDIPVGYSLTGIAGVSGTGNVTPSLVSCSNTFPIASGGSQTCYVRITDQNPGVIEDLLVGLQFALTGVPEFTSAPANVRITLYPPGGYFVGDNLPWLIAPAAYDLRYSPLYINCDVKFQTIADLSGRLLSVFNVSDEVWDTGYGIMNGSGVPDSLIKRYGPDFIINSLPQTGAVKVYMYPMYTPSPDPNDPFGYGDEVSPGQPYIFTTSATARPGIGLDANGRVPWNGTWAVLNSQLCQYAKLDTNADGVGDGVLCSNAGTAFEGFVIFQTEFFNAEGVNFIADWASGDATMSHGYPMINLRWRASEISEREMIEEMYYSAPED